MIKSIVSQVKVWIFREECSLYFTARYLCSCVKISSSKHCKGHMAYSSWWYGHLHRKGSRRRMLLISIVGKPKLNSKWVHSKISRLTPSDSLLLKGLQLSQAGGPQLRTNHMNLDRTFHIHSTMEPSGIYFMLVCVWAKLMISEHPKNVFFWKTMSFPSYEINLTILLLYFKNWSITVPPQNIKPLRHSADT